MAQVQRNRNALRSQRLIKEAYVSLTLGRTKERYTVSDICRMADINRSTFYAHYDNIDDLEEKLFQAYLEGIAAWLGDALAKGFREDPLPHLTRLGDYIEENRPLFQAFMVNGVRDDSGYGFGMAVRAALLPVLGDVSMRRLIRFDLICSALTSVYFTWLVGSYEGIALVEVNEEMAEVIRRKG